MPYSRRAWLKRLVGLAAAPFLLRDFGLPAPSVAQEVVPSPRSVTWTQTAADFAAGEAEGLAAQGDGGLTLQGGAAVGRYVSPPWRADFPFNALALTWQVDVPDGAVLALSLRASADGVAWTDWLPVEESADLRDATDERSSDVMIAHGQYVQWAAQLHGSVSAAPRLWRLSVIAIDSSAGPRAADAQPDTPDAAGAVAPPGIISRAAWGCPQPYGSPNWPPEYRRVEKVVVHHTATANDYDDGAAVVRAVWYYHTVSRGWGDVGYNYLVDRFGNVYQGRYGGDDVIAGHALCYNPGSVGIAVIGNFEQGDVPAAALNALTRLVAWLAYRRDVHPLGSSYFVDRVLPNISTHRDLNNNRSNPSGRSCYMNTACPGERLYERIYTAWPPLRERVWNTFPDYGDGWLSHNTPTGLGPGETVTVRLSVVNRGRLTWSAGGGNPVRLGYHWYRPDGSQVVQDPADDHRTPLPGDLGYGQGAQVQALLTAPRVPGTYSLKWDMVHEGVTWFAWQGVATLDVDVTVIAPRLAVGRGALHFRADPQRPPLPQSVPILNAGRGALPWQATSDQGWCRLGAAQGNAPAALVVSVDRNGLTPGATYNAVVTVSSPGVDGSPQQIPVTFTYSAQPLRRTFLPGVAGRD